MLAIQCHQQGGFSLSAISRKLGRCASAIIREVQHDATTEGACTGEQAQRQSVMRRRAASAQPRIGVVRWEAMALACARTGAPIGLPARVTFPSTMKAPVSTSPRTVRVAAYCGCTCVAASVAGGTAEARPIKCQHSAGRHIQERPPTLCRRLNSRHRRTAVADCWRARPYGSCCLTWAWGHIADDESVGRRMSPMMPLRCPRIATDAATSYRTQKRPEPLLLLGLPAFVGLRWSLKWWRWREPFPNIRQVLILLDFSLKQIRTRRRS